MGSANKGSDNGLMDEITTFATDYRQPHPCWSPMAQAGSSSCPASPASQQGLQSQLEGMTIKDLLQEIHIPLATMQFIGLTYLRVRMERTCKDLHRWFHGTFNPHWPRGALSIRKFVWSGYEAYGMYDVDSGDTCNGISSTQ